jgi:hypothetical protein
MIPGRLRVSTYTMMLSLSERKMTKTINSTQQFETTKAAPGVEVFVPAFGIPSLCGLDLWGRFSWLKRGLPFCPYHSPLSFGEGKKRRTRHRVLTRFKIEPDTLTRFKATPWLWRWLSFCSCERVAFIERGVDFDTIYQEMEDLVRLGSPANSELVDEKGVPLFNRWTFAGIKRRKNYEHILPLVPGPQTMCGFLFDALLGKRIIDYGYPTPEPYVGSKRRCQVCGAVDGVPYPRLLKTLTASNSAKGLDVCEIFRGLCNRSACVQNRRFIDPPSNPEWETSAFITSILAQISSETPDNFETHGKGSYPSGYCAPSSHRFDWGCAPSWILDPAEVNVHWTLAAWASNPLPDHRDYPKPGRCWPHPHAKVDFETTAMHWLQVRYPEHLLERYGPSKLDFGDSPTGQRETHRLETYKSDSGEWKIRKVIDKVFDIFGSGTRTSEEREAVEASRFKAERRRDEYNKDLPQVILGPSLEMISAAKWEEKLKAAMGDEYHPPEIPRSRILETIRKKAKLPEPLRPVESEIETQVSVSEGRQWEIALENTFGAYRVDASSANGETVFVDGLYILLKRKQQALRVHLLFPNEVEDPDDTGYAEIERLPQAIHNLTKVLGLPSRTLRGPQSLRVLTFSQSGAQTRVVVAYPRWEGAVWFSGKKLQTKILETQECVQVPLNQEDEG